MAYFFFFSSRRRHTRCSRDWSSDVCSSDLAHDVLHGRGEEVHRLGRGCLLDRERVALQRPAFLRGGFAGRAQWGAPAPARGRLGPLRLGERRGGEKGRIRWGADHLKKKKID